MWIMAKRDYVVVVILEISTMSSFHIKRIPHLVQLPVFVQSFKVYFPRGRAR